MMSSRVIRHFYVVLTLISCWDYTIAYHKYYIEDECTSSTKTQKIIFRLPATGPDSVGEIRSNRFGTYSRTERNCLLKLNPPKGYGIVLNVIRVDFRNQSNCKDYIEVSDGEDVEEKLCNAQDLDQTNLTFFSNGEMKVKYHTSGGGMGFNNGVKLIFTTTKLGEECSSPNEFKCSNAHCIWVGATCDGINNCGDGSDERFAEYPHCRTYQQLSKTLFSLLAEITPVAVTAVIVGISTFVAVVVTMCICCCRSQPEKSEKPILYRDCLSVPNGEYTPLPGYNYSSPGHPYTPIQPFYSNGPYSQMRCIPLVQQKVEIKYDRPPPYHV